jgi:co-chaperonin GroES (HSP10)
MIATLIAILIVLVGAGAELYVYFHSKKHPIPEPEKFLIGKNLKFWAFGDRVIIREDEFKSGYECVTCNGSGSTPCTNCDGAGFNGEKNCSACNTSGTSVCIDCSGKGGLLITPETAERRPTSGTIVSVGHKVTTMKVGDAVLYSNFAGYVVDLTRAGQKISMRILHETEILTGMEGHLTLNNLRGKTEIASFGN